MRGLIDLHLHLDGSLSSDTVRRLAAMQNIGLSLSDAELKKRLTVGRGCRSLNEYLEKFDFPLSLMQTADALSESVYSLSEELKKQGLVYAEIRFAPQLHTKCGLTQEDAVRAAISGLNRSDFCARLILCCMRGIGNENENMTTAQLTVKYLGKGVCALDLAGAEGLYPTVCYADIFQYARKNGVPFTIHAGEADGAESVRAAVRFGAARIGHGVRAFEDAALVKELAEKNITLELCPTSNLNTCVFSDISEYPIKRFIESGVRVTVNTDNMTVSDTTLERELDVLKNTFGFDDTALLRLAVNAAQSAFYEDKKTLIRRIEQAFPSGK